MRANRPSVKTANSPSSATEYDTKAVPVVDPYADSPVYAVSDSHFNMFLFPARIKKLHIGASVPLISDEEKKTILDKFGDESGPYKVSDWGEDLTFMIAAYGVQKNKSDKE